MRIVKKLAIIVPVIIIAVVAVHFIMQINEENNLNVTYLEGISAYEAGNYEDARAAFESVGDYEDAESMLKEIDYEEAILAIEAGDDETAEEILLTMTDYKDAQSYLYLITYHKVLACMEAGDYDQAEIYADEITGYEDIAELKQEIIYQKALICIDAADFDGAKELLASVSDTELVEDAVASMNYTEYAVPCLQDLYSRYADSSTQISEILEARCAQVSYNTGAELPLIMIHYTVVTEAGETEELYAAYNNYTYYGACHTIDKSAVDMSNQEEMAGFLKIQPYWDKEGTVTLSAPAMKILAGIS